MISLDSRWRPLKGGAVSFVDDAGVIPDGHVFPADAPIQFPGSKDRHEYELKMHDAWAAVIGLSDYAAFNAFGPCGEAQGDSEPASEWQGVLDRLRAMDPATLRQAVEDHRDADRLVVDVETGIGVRAKTLAAFLESTAYSDLMAGRKLSNCQHCGRYMVMTKSTQTYCSTRCRMAVSRQKDAG